MSDQQPDLAERIAASWIIGNDPSKAMLRVQLANIIRQSLSGYCVVKREVLEEVRDCLKERVEVDEGIRKVFEEPLEDCEWMVKEQAALTKLNEILGGKQ